MRFIYSALNFIALFFFLAWCGHAIEISADLVGTNNILFILVAASFFVSLFLALGALINAVWYLTTPEDL